jgi:hypothetical protein
MLLTTPTETGVVSDSDAEALEDSERKEAPMRRVVAASPARCRREAPAKPVEMRSIMRRYRGRGAPMMCWIPFNGPLSGHC